MELQQAQLADPVAAVHYERQLATQTAAPDVHEPPHAPQPEATPQLNPAQSLPQLHGRESAERQAEEPEDIDAPGMSAGNSKPVSLGWGRLKKVKLAAKAEGSQDVGSKRKRDTDTGDCTKAVVTVSAALMTRIVQCKP